MRLPVSSTELITQFCTDNSVHVLWLDNWHESLRSGKNQVVLGSLQTPLGPATLQLIPGHLRCLPVFLFINQP